MAKMSALDLLKKTFSEFLEDKNYVIYIGKDRNNYEGMMLHQFNEKDKDHRKAKKEVEQNISNFFSYHNSYGPSLTTMMIFLKYLLINKKPAQIKSVIAWYHPTGSNDTVPFEYITKLLSRYDNKGLAEYLARPSIVNRFHVNKLKDYYHLLKGEENKERAISQLLEHEDFDRQWFQVSIYEVFKEFNVNVDKYKDRFTKINFEVGEDILGDASKREILEIPYNQKDLMSLGVDLKSLSHSLDSAFVFMIIHLNDYYTELLNIDRIEATESSRDNKVTIIGENINKEFMYLLLNNLIVDLRKTGSVVNLDQESECNKIIERVYSETQKILMSDVVGLAKTKKVISKI